MVKQYRIKENSPLSTLIVQVDLSVGSWDSPSITLTKEGIKTEYDLTPHLSHSYYSQHIEEVKKNSSKPAVVIVKKVQSIATPELDSPKVGEVLPTVDIPIPEKEVLPTVKIEKVEEKNVEDTEVKEVKESTKNKRTVTTRGRSGRR